MNFGKLIFYFQFLFIIIACDSRKENNEILAKEIFYKTILDLAEAEAFVNSYVAKDSTKNKSIELTNLYQQVFSIHKTNSKQFMKSFEYYLSQPIYARDMMDSLQTRAKKVTNYATKSVSPQ